MSFGTLGSLILLSLMTLVSCTLQPKLPSEEALYFDSAYDDHNRAPASMTPPADAADSVKRIDPTNQRALADYHFAAGEAYSFDGVHAKAIESFKTVLIYDPESVQVRLRLAAEYVKSGSISEALRCAEEAVKKDPKKIESHLLLGGLYSSLKNYKSAIEEYDTALKINPKSSDAMMYLGALYAEQKEHDKAIRSFELLIKNEDYPSPQIAYYYIGRVREAQAQPRTLKAAEASYKKALELKPNYPEALVALSSFYVRQKQNGLAIEFLRKFQRDYGPNLRIAEVLSSLYLQEEKYDLAIEQFELIEADPDESLDIKMKMALIYIDQKQYPQASVKLNEVLSQAPDSDKVRFYLAAVYEEMAKTDLAVEHFSKVPAGSSYYQDSIVHAAYLLKEMKKNKEAIALVEKALSDRKDIPQFYAVYASLMDSRGQVENAIQLLEGAIVKFPDYAQLRFFLGTLYDRKGEKLKSVEQMQKLIEMDPNHVQGLNYLAFTYAEMGTHLVEAEGMAKRAIEIEPKDGFVLDTYGWILYKQGKHRDAVKVLENAHAQQPEESVIAEHLGDAYYKSQLIEKARKMYQKAVEFSTEEGRSQAIRSKISSIEKQEVPGYRERSPASATLPSAVAVPAPNRVGTSEH